VAQSPQERVKAANQAIIAAGLKGDAEGMGRLLADDLWWIRSNAALLTKAQFIATINPGIGRSRRTFTEETVTIHGDIAVLVCRSNFVSPQDEPRAERVLRVFVNRGGKWLLLSHAASPLAP
jgi:ketosteroid isomerase-like protein